MMTAPLYMTEKVGMMTWSRSEPAPHLYTDACPSARSHMPVRPRGEAAAKSNEEHWPTRASTRLPTFSRAFLISYATKGA